MRHTILTAKAKRRIRNKLLKCTCDGYWFPHRVGSLGCKFLHHGEYKDFGVYFDDHTIDERCVSAYPF